MEKIQHWKCGEMVWDLVFALTDVGQIPGQVPSPLSLSFTASTWRGLQ